MSRFICILNDFLQRDIDNPTRRKVGMRSLRQVTIT